MKNSLVGLFICLLIAGCSSSDSPTDTPTTGNLTISVDETFKPFIDSEISTFEGIYTYADIEVTYKPEIDAFNDLLADTVKLIIASRPFNKEELEVFKKWEIVPRITKIAYDGVALISSKDQADSNITMAELRDLLSGKSVKSFDNTKVVFDNSKSGTISYMRNKTGISEFSKNCFAVNSNEAVIDYVSKQSNSIGIIGANWISDRDDSTNLSFLKSVRVLEVGADDSEYFKPFQAYIAQKNYPLWREIYVLSKEAYTGLGSGLTAFLASERGQRIILKSGLVPATMPVRFVEFVPNEDFPNF